MAGNHKTDCGCFVCASVRGSRVKTRKRAHRADTLASWREGVEIARNVLYVALYTGPTILVIAGVLKGLLLILSL